MGARLGTLLLSGDTTDETKVLVAGQRRHVRQQVGRPGRDAHGGKALAIGPIHGKRALLTTLGLVLATTLVLVLVVSARGGRVDPSQAAADASTSSVQTPDATTTPVSVPSASTTRQGQNPVTRVIQWLNDQAPLGGGADGPEDEAFGAMLEGDCENALRLSEVRSGDRLPQRSRTLYEAAGSACLAAFERRPELWPRAEAALKKTLKNVSRLDCQQQTVYRLLARLVDLHRTHPNAQLVKEVRGKRGALVCPRFTRITPERGPAEGGFLIRLEGVNLPRVVGVNFGWEHHLTAVSEDGRHVVITAPAGTPDDLRFVWPDGWPWGNAHNVEFYYDPPGTTTRPSTTTTKPQVTSSTSTTTTTPSPPSS